MEFERKDPDCKFMIPDVITVRQQMAFYSEFPVTSGADLFERMWIAGRKLIEQWDCPLFPDKDADLDSVSDPEIPHVLIWAGTQIQRHIDGLQTIPKNS